MNILVAAVSDDNYGDTVIRVCFNALVRTVLKNLGITASVITDLAMNSKAMKQVDEKLIAKQDIICFAGGGLIKYDYLRLYHYIDTITEIAETHDIPVIFSSVGVEPFDGDNEKCLQLKNALRRRCVKSISVRDDLGALEDYIADTEIERSRVCDPAVWTPYVYGVEKCRDSETIGINVVRGGLFKANGKNWGSRDEMGFLLELRKLLEKKDLKYKFFTNGSFLDENFLRDFQTSYDIPDEQVISQINCSEKLVTEISRFKAVLAFRMHANIIAYSQGIPSVALAWHDKLTWFYEHINLQDRVFAFDEWGAEKVFAKLCEAMSDVEEIEPSEDYLMSVYENLFHVISRYCADKVQLAQGAPRYSFEKVKETMRSCREDLSPYNDYDTSIKLVLGGHRYLERFREVEKKNKQVAECAVKITAYEKQISDYENRIGEYQNEIDDHKKRTKKMQQQLDQINGMFVMRCIRFARRKRKQLLGR